MVAIEHPDSVFEPHLGPAAVFRNIPRGRSLAIWIRVPAQGTLGIGSALEIAAAFNGPAELLSGERS
jgi:hypothetical protein